MKADSLRISKVFASGGDVHYVLPHFQREYAWEKTEWQALLTDVFSVYAVYPTNDDSSVPIPEHFMGSIKPRAVELLGETCMVALSPSFW